MKIAVVHNGVDWGTVDVAFGVAYGLEAHGVEVFRCTPQHALAMAQVFQVDAVIVVTAIRPTSLVETLVDAGLCVTALFTESPYEEAAELVIARQVAGCWTHERASLPVFRTVTDRVAYLPHGWHPVIHTPTPQPLDASVPAHDVVFVGGGVRERIAFFNAIDWTGIDLGLYGVWRNLGLKPEVEACVRSDGPITNRTAAALYRRAKVGLNLYRRLPAQLVPDRPEHWVTAESLNPRAYELAACGTQQISERRAESGDVFGGLVPTFRTPAAAESMIRARLGHPHLRDGDPADVIACVAQSSWVDRAGQVLADLHAWQHLAEVPQNLLL
jgi:spore maturation protein CgeB